VGLGKIIVKQLSEVTKYVLNFEEPQIERLTFYFDHRCSNNCDFSQN
jgi:hypothetical protein